MPGKENPFRRFLDNSSRAEKAAETQRQREKEERDARDRMQSSLTATRLLAEEMDRRELRKQLEKDPRFKRIMTMVNHPFLEEALQEFYRSFTDKEKYPLDKRVGLSIRPNAKELIIHDGLRLTKAGEIEGTLGIWVPTRDGEKGSGTHVNFEWINKPIRPTFVPAEPRPTNRRVELYGNDLTYTDHFEGMYCEPGVAIETIYEVRAFSRRGSDYDDYPDELYTYPIHAIPPTTSLVSGNVYDSKRKLPDNTLIFADQDSFKTWHDMFIRTNMDDVLKELGVLYLRLQKQPPFGQRYE